MLKQATKEALILIGAAVAIALAVYAVRPDKIGPATAAVDQATVSPLPTENGFSEISLEELEELQAVMEEID